MPEPRASERLAQSLQNGGGKIITEGAFVIAVLLAVAFVVFVEILPAVGWSLGNCAERRGVPWGLVAIMGLLVAPKTLGSAVTAGLLGRLLGNKKGNDS